MCDREQLSFPGGILAVHGDAVDREDRANLRFRRLSNSVLSYWVLRLMPGGPRFASWVKRRMHVRRAGMTSSVPEAQLQRFAEACFARGTRTIFVGHYHTPYEYRRPDGCALHVVPAWCEGEEIGVVDRKTGGVQFGPWQTLIG
jgi:UDP-2,3-diacylglucosamine pyrophosphatase LpxH